MVQLTFCPVDWLCADRGSSRNTVEIRASVLDTDNKSAFVRIPDYTPYIYLELPTIRNGRERKWCYEDIAELHRSLTRAINKTKHNEVCGLTSQDYTLKKPLFYYQDTKPMVRFHFRSLDALRHASNLLRAGLYYRDEGKLTGCKVHLQEIDPILKFLVDRNMRHTAWFTGECTEVTNEDDKISTCDREYTIPYRTCMPSDYEGSFSPQLLSYDIEVYSHNYKAFPREWNPEDVSYLITCVFFRTNQPQTEWKRYAILWGDCKYDKDIDKFELIRVHSEDELILTFSDLIGKNDTDIITGYNIMQFDNGYLDARLKIMEVDWPSMGRLKNDAGEMTRMRWESGAYGVKKIDKFYIPGRIVMDYYEETRRSQKWDTYTLDNAAKQILESVEDQKHKLSAEDMFRIYDYYREWRDQTDTAAYQDAIEQMKIVVDYGVQDAEIVARMVCKTNWTIASREMSNVVGVTMQDLFIRGQQHRCMSLLFRMCTKMDIVMDKREFGRYSFAGGLVQDPVKGLHLLVLTLDFASLYPNIMIAHNLSHDTLIHPEDVQFYAPEDVESATMMMTEKKDDDEEDLLDKDEKKEVPATEMTFTFIKREVYEGVAPRVLVELLAMRKAVRKQQNDHKKGSFMHTVLEKRQLAYKVSANSLYGFFGVQKGGKRPCVEVAATVTYWGRTSIMKAIKAVLAHYEGSKLIYGDTDSLMVTLPGVTLANAWKRANELAKFTEELFPKPLVMEPEWPADILAIKPKCYAKCKVDEETNDYFRNADGTRKYEFKGLMPTRRDTCEWAKTVCAKSIELVMEGATYPEVVDYIATDVMDLYTGNVPLDRLVVSKSLSSGYANESATMNVFAKAMEKIGKPIAAGERHKYVILDRPNVKRIGDKMMLLIAFESGECTEPLDYGYYYKNLLMKKLDTILDAYFAKWGDILDGYAITVGGHTITARTPGRLIQKICAVNKDDPQAQLNAICNMVDTVHNIFPTVGLR